MQCNTKSNSLTIKHWFVVYVDVLTLFIDFEFDFCPYRSLYIIIWSNKGYKIKVCQFNLVRLFSNFKVGKAGVTRHENHISEAL